jgi:hypothetical protein
MKNGNHKSEALALHLIQACADREALPNGYRHGTLDSVFDVQDVGRFMRNPSLRSTVAEYLRPLKRFEKRQNNWLAPRSVRPSRST